MEAIFEMIGGLVEAASDPNSPTHEIGDMAQFLVAAAERADGDVLDRIVGELAPVIDINSPHAPVTFVLAGALVERGASAERVAAAVLHPLPDALAACAKYVETLEAEHGTITEEVWAASEATRPRAWLELELIWRPCVAVLGASPAARSSMKAHAETASRIEDLHVGGTWLAPMLRVLDDEPLHVIHDESGRTFDLTMSGIARNFELLTLLAGALIGDGLLDGERPSDAALATARGEGPQQCFERIAVVWNLVDANGEPIARGGLPADIPVVDGRRVVHLVAPDEPGDYAGHRTFATLGGKLTSEGS